VTAWNSLCRDRSVGTRSSGSWGRTPTLPPKCVADRKGLELENLENCPQRPHRALALIQARPELFARHAAVTADWKRRGPRRVGPYHRLRYYDGRVRRSIYLGLPGPLVDEVRQALEVLQARWQRQRAFARWRGEIVGSLRGHKRLLDRRLRVLGLRLKGYEVRGWRASSLTDILR
jgi:hypothetical protein